jgi:hypothetical protein
MYRRGNDRVVFLTCGLNGDITTIGGLPAYLRGLNPPVQNGSVVTYDTLGHSRHIGVSLNQTHRELTLMLAARDDRDDHVGNATDLALANSRVDAANAIPNPLPVPQYAVLIQPFLRAEAYVGLYHCWTADPYDFFANAQGGAVNRPSIAQQMQTALTPPVTVIGIGGQCAFPYYYVRDSNHDGVIEANEVRGLAPRPTDGRSWRVNP